MFLFSIIVFKMIKFLAKVKTGFTIRLTVLGFRFCEKSSMSFKNPIIYKKIEIFDKWDINKGEDAIILWELMLSI